MLTLATGGLGGRRDHPARDRGEHDGGREAGGEGGPGDGGALGTHRAGGPGGPGRAAGGVAGPGLWIVKSDGGVDAFGAPWYGSLRGQLAAGSRRRGSPESNTVMTGTTRDGVTHLSAQKSGRGGLYCHWPASRCARQASGVWRRDPGPDQRAKVRANDRRREGAPGHVQPRLSQVDAISGDIRRRPATVEIYLTSEGSLVRTQLRPPGQK